MKELGGDAVVLNGDELQIKEKVSPIPQGYYPDM